MQWLIIQICIWIENYFLQIPTIDRNVGKTKLKMWVWEWASQRECGWEIAREKERKCFKCICLKLNNSTQLNFSNRRWITSKWPLRIHNWFLKRKRKCREWRWAFRRWLALMFVESILKSNQISDDEILSVSGVDLMRDGENNQAAPFEWFESWMKIEFQMISLDSISSRFLIEAKIMPEISQQNEYTSDSWQFTATRQPSQKRFVSFMNIH